MTTEGSASEGGPAIRVDSAKDFPIEPTRTDAAANGRELLVFYMHVCMFLLVSNIGIKSICF